MNAAQVDLQQLRIKHILFKSKVRSVLYGGVFDSQFFSAAGPVESWFSGVGLPRYRQHPEMLQLHAAHRSLNDLALRLITLHNMGKIDQAHKEFSELEQLSAKFLETLTALEQKLK